MTRKLWVTALMMTAGLAGSAMSASAQDWWNPGRWFNPRSRSGYRTGYVTGYAPTYGAATYPNGNCGSNNGVCRNGTCGNRGSGMGPTVPGYRSAPSVGNFTPYSTPGYGSSNYRGPTSNRPRSNPFYE